jgi:hypothetical protein
VSGVAITGLTPSLGQHVFFLRLQHREPLDVLKIMVDAGFGRKHRPSDGAGHVQRPPASQAIKALEAGGYLVRQRSQADGRSVTLRLTDKGHEVVARDPFKALVRAVGSLDPQEQTAMHDALHRVLATLAASGTHQHFGVCRDCAHLSGEMNSDSMGASRSIPECLLFGAPIEPDDAVLLCVHFRPKSEYREDGHRE